MLVHQVFGAYVDLLVKEVSDRPDLETIIKSNLSKRESLRILINNTIMHQSK